MCICQIKKSPNVNHCTLYFRIVQGKCEVAAKDGCQSGSCSTLKLDRIWTKRLLKGHQMLKQTDRQTDRQTDIQTYGRTDGRTDRQTNRKTDRKTDRQTGRQAGRQADRQTGRQTDRRCQLWCLMHMLRGPCQITKNQVTCKLSITLGMFRQAVSIMVSPIVHSGSN